MCLYRLWMCLSAEFTILNFLSLSLPPLSKVGTRKIEILSNIFFIIWKYLRDYDSNLPHFSKFCSWFLTITFKMTCCPFPFPLYCTFLPRIHWPSIFLFLFSIFIIILFFIKIFLRHLYHYADHFFSPN